MDCKHMDRDQARSYWQASGLTYDAVTTRNIKLLRSMIDVSMRKSHLIDDTLRAGKCKVNNTKSGKWADIRCNSRYFKDRQAVTFESDGFIGFAGWADDTNVQPILSAFIEWVDEISQKRAT